MPYITHPDLPGSSVLILDEAVDQWASAGWTVTDPPEGTAEAQPWVVVADPPPPEDASEDDPPKSPKSRTRRSPAPETEGA